MNNGHLSDKTREGLQKNGYLTKEEIDVAIQELTANLRITPLKRDQAKGKE